MGFALMILGLVITVGAFIFAVVSLMAGGPFDASFRNHARALVLMVLGGVVAATGFLIGGWQSIWELMAR
jgi:heme/copper-type cytochrome/quinol oxidase subunit 1